MIQIFRKYLRQMALLAAVLCVEFASPLPAIALDEPMLVAQAQPGNGVNVILMIGDGMGWNMARAAAVANGAPFYQSGKGQGLSFQELEGYALATTYGTTIRGTSGVFNTGNSALTGSNTLTGASPVRPGFTFKATPFNEGTDPSGVGGATDATLGNLVGYKPRRGGPNPWTPIGPGVAARGGYDKEYIKYSYPDSANTATSLYTGVKTYNNAIAVDVFEKDLTTVLQTATSLGKSTGLVTSVPITHATPGAATATVNRRSKYDSDFPALDSILEEALLQDEDGDKFLPTVLLGGGHPLDHENTTAVGPVNRYTYIRQSTYDALRANPTSNRYNYNFLERGPNAGNALLAASEQLNPNQGQRLLGLYGARGQNGNIPISGADGKYSRTGLDNFSLFSSANATTNPTPGIPRPDTVRPLAPGETVDQFIARERSENPTLAQMTRAALNVLGKDRDGFWLMVEGGDIDWAAHDNNMNNLIGTMNDFDRSVRAVMNWVKQNGGWEKNVLIVTADHDHYLTLRDNFPQVLRRAGAEAVTFARHDPAGAGHFWGSDVNRKYGWGNHSNRPVPVYYQGNAFNLDRFVGKDFIEYGQVVPGIRGLVDQTQIHQAMVNALQRR